MQTRRNYDLPRKRVKIINLANKVKGNTKLVVARTLVLAYVLLLSYINSISNKIGRTSLLQRTHNDTRIHCIAKNIFFLFFLSFSFIGWSLGAFSMTFIHECIWLIGLVKSVFFPYFLSQNVSQFQSTMIFLLMDEIDYWWQEEGKTG